MPCNLSLRKDVTCGSGRFCDSSFELSEMASGQELVSGKRHERNNIWSLVVEASCGFSSLDSSHCVDFGQCFCKDRGGRRGFLSTSGALVGKLAATDLAASRSARVGRDLVTAGVFSPPRHVCNVTSEVQDHTPNSHDVLFSQITALDQWCPVRTHGSTGLRGVSVRHM